jgi:hypothetical protein
MRSLEQTLNNDTYAIVAEKVWEAVSGRGIYKNNRRCYSLAETIRVEFGIPRHELVNELMCSIMEKNLLQKYNIERSLGWFIVGVVWRLLENTLRELRDKKKLDDVVADRIKMEMEDEYRLPNWGNPESLYFKKERHEIIMKHVSEDEYDLLCGTLSTEEYSLLHHISLRSAERHKKSLACKLLISLTNLGYDKLF